MKRGIEKLRHRRIYKIWSDIVYEMKTTSWTLENSSSEEEMKLYLSVLHSSLGKI